jgi:hypothetical protein
MFPPTTPCLVNETRYKTFCVYFEQLKMKKAIITVSTDMHRIVRLYSAPGMYHIEKLSDRHWNLTKVDGDVSLPDFFTFVQSDEIEHARTGGKYQIFDHREGATKTLDLLARQEQGLTVDGLKKMPSAFKF